MRRFAGWLLSKHHAAVDLCEMAKDRDDWERTARNSAEVANRAVATAARYADELANTQAELDSLRADFETYVLTGERRRG